MREPPLSSVYVRQQVRVRATTNRNEREDTTAGRPTAEEPAAASGPRAAVPVTDALEHHDHLVITGEPGAGKSTMSSYLAGSLSRLWLREDSAVDAPITEPVVPLRVSARSLDSNGSWSAVLAEAACRSLGRSLLEDPDPGLFAGRVQGTRWLVLVDGLDEIPDPRLRELVRNPLLATIAAVSAVKEPGKPLPTSRISLYERFCSYLAGDRSGKRNPLTQLRQHHEDNPELLTFVRWLHQSRSEILGALARRRLESRDDQLWQGAVEWVRDRVPEDVVLIDGWEDHLWEELVGTGLLAAREREFRFLHQSFAEFLSARSHAETIGDDFGELDAWIRRGLREADRTFLLFTFAMWADQPGHDIGAVVDRLLSSLDPRRILLAGRLMAEGVSVPDTMAIRVIDRLFMLVRNLDNSNSGWADEGFEVLGGLFDHPAVPARLDALAGDQKVRWSRRVSALEAFERLRGGERAQLLLAELLPSVYGQPLHKCARIAARLGQAAIDMVKHRALQMAEEPDSDADERTDATEVMRIFNLATDVAGLARSVLESTRSTSQHLRRATEAWLAVQGESAIPEIAALAGDRPVDDHEGRARLAASLEKAGDGTTAEFLAGAILEDEAADGDAVVMAAKTLLLVHGAAAVPRVLLAADRWSAGSNRQRVWQAARILKHLAAYPEAAVVSRVSALLVGWIPNGIGAHNLIEAWLAMEPGGRFVLDSIDRGTALCTYDQAWTAQHLQDAGEQAAATELAVLVLRSRHGSRTEYKQAASVLLKADRVVAVSQLMSLGKQNPKSAWLAGVMDALDDPDLEVEEACVFCARALVAHPQIDGEALRDALGNLLCLEGESAAQSAAEAARTRPELSIYQRRQLVCALAAVGQLDLARSVWSHLLGWQGYTPRDDVSLVDDFLNAGVEQWAAERMRELIDDPATAPLRGRRLRQMLAWLTAG
ncbi:MAG: NACHT domain-containing protein [Pseudonocardiaceae bacterium]